MDAVATALFVVLATAVAGGACGYLYLCVLACAQWFDEGERAPVEQPAPRVSYPRRRA